MTCGALTFHAAAVADQPEDLASFLQLVFGEAGILGGLWLACAKPGKRIRSWVAAAFVGLWAASLYRVVAGCYSCGRLGVLAVSPWASLAFDVAALIFLLRQRPTKGRSESPSGPLDLLGPVTAALLTATTAIGLPDLVAVAGTALWGGRPLEDRPLVLTGRGVVFHGRIDHNGSFRLPPIRPGRYTVRVGGGPPLLSPGAGPADRVAAGPGRRGPGGRKKAEAAGTPGGRARPENRGGAAVFRANKDMYNLMLEFNN